MNTTTVGNQEDPPVAMDTDGDFAVVWEVPEGGTLEGIAFRRFSAAGAPLTDELAVNTTTAGDQDDPAIASASDGRGVVAWESPDAGLDEGVKARLFGTSGPAGAEIDVNTGTAGAQDSVDVAMDAGGDFVVAWESDDADGRGVLFRR